MTSRVIKVVTARAGRDRLHGHLTNILLTVQCLVEAAQGRGRPSKPDALALPSPTLDLQAVIPLNDMMALALQGDAPDALTIEFTAGLPRGYVAPERQARVLNGLMTSLISAQFVLFMAEGRDAIAARWGEDHSKWPSTLSFARIIRNAAAHGGALYFTNPSAAPVTWRTVTYGPSMNGRRILGTELWVPDLLMLMAEVQDELDAP